MQLIASRTALLTALKRAGAAIVPGDAQAFKSSVLITSAEGLTTIGASSGLLRVECKLDCETKKPGRAVLTHRRLTAIVTELPPGKVEITVDEKLRVKIRSLESKRHFQMTGQEVEIFPAMHQEAGEALYTVEAKILQQAASEIAFVIDKGYIDGALLAPGEERKFRMIAYSSWGLSMATGWFSGSEPVRGQDVLLPKALLEAVQALTPEDQLIIQSDAHRVTVVAPDTTISCDRLAQNFPDVWKQVLASAPTQKRFRVSSERLLESVKAVSVAAEVVEGAERFIQIDIAYKSPHCLVATRKNPGGGGGYGEDELVVLDPSDGACVIHMDGQRLTQALRSFVPVDLDLFYDVVGNQEALLLQNESLFTLLMPVSEVKAKS